MGAGVRLDMHVRMCLNVTCNTMQRRIGSDACRWVDVAPRPLDIRLWVENCKSQRHYSADCGVSKPTAASDLWPVGGPVQRSGAGWEKLVVGGGGVLDVGVLLLDGKINRRVWGGRRGSTVARSLAASLRRRARHRLRARGKSGGSANESGCQTRLLQGCADREVLEQQTTAPGLEELWEKKKKNERERDGEEGWCGGRGGEIKKTGMRQKINKVTERGRNATSEGETWARWEPRSAVKAEGGGNREKCWRGKRMDGVSDNDRGGGRRGGRHTETFAW